MKALLFTMIKDQNKSQDGSVLKVLLGNKSEVEKLENDIQRLQELL